MSSMFPVISTLIPFFLRSILIVTPESWYHFSLDKNRRGEGEHHSYILVFRKLLSLSCFTLDDVSHYHYILLCFCSFYKPVSSALYKCTKWHTVCFLLSELWTRITCSKSEKNELNCCTCEKIQEIQEMKKLLVHSKVYFKGCIEMYSKYIRYTVRLCRGLPTLITDPYQW